MLSAERQFRDLVVLRPTRELSFPRTAVLAALLLLAACGPQPTAAPPATASPQAQPTTVAATATPPTATAPQAAPTPAGPRELTVCLGEEPRSLYRYARPEPGRDHLLAALTDGPLDAHDYGFEPVIVVALPKPVTRTVRASPGQLVVDALDRVLPLQAGLTLHQADGSRLAYDGAGPVDLPQTAATFRLRPGLRWSDGAPLTAADSVFAYALGRSPDSTDPWRVVADRTASYTAPDDLTLVWTGLPGYVDPLAHTHVWPPLPKHLWAGLSAEAIADSEQANTQPLSWGPFVLAEWVPGERLVLDRNPAYWRAAEGLPKLDRLTVRFVDGPEALAAALAGGACQLAPSGPTLDQAAPALAATQGIRLEHVPGPVLEHLDYGLLPAAGPATFTDPRVRLGLAQCLDRAALAPYPADPPPDSYLPPGHPFYVPAGAPAFDPARGRALLAEAGWTDTQGDGVVTLAGGPGSEALLAAISAQLEANCGVAVARQPLTEGELLGDWLLGVVFGRRFDLAVFGWRVGAVPPCALYTSAQLADEANPGGANAAGYANAVYDEACRRALTVPAAAAEAYAETQRRLLADLPLLPLFFRPRHGATLPGVEGYVLDGSSESELWNIENIALR